MKTLLSQPETTNQICQKNFPSSNTVRIYFFNILSADVTRDNYLVGCRNLEFLLHTESVIEFACNDKIFHCVTVKFYFLRWWRRFIAQVNDFDRVLFAEMDG
ncbi:unnamed protein product [Schistosoma rodhaini]|uniref:Uncharacterized protein n=1 Tax=Schistosoma rodhaini TaxID=6188 RepID=A0AA85G581_9TREM|nr:unnamed protein product [Schistosoma rodhaini]